jgi:uncharacterized membrane protein HdeD (DUF308 family)
MLRKMGYWMLASSRWSLVAGYWLLAAGLWFLASGFGCMETAYLMQNGKKYKA